MNITEPESLTFLDSLDYLLVDCRSGDPKRAESCIINTALGALTGLVLPVFIPTGLVFNSLIVYIFLFKQSPWTRQNVYISMIAIADNCNIFMNGFMWMFLAKGLPWVSNGTAGYIHVNSSSLACSIVRYLEHLCHVTSSALFLLMVIDRALSLFFPFKLRGMSGKSAMKASAAVILFCIAITVPQGYLYRWIYSDGVVVCMVDYEGMQGWASTGNFYYNLLLYFPPLIFLTPILLGNLLLIVKVRMIIADRKNLTESSADQQSIRNTVVCVTLSVVLLVSFIPIIVADIMNFALSQINPNVAEEGGLTVVWGLTDIGVTLVNINQSVNWIFLAWKSDQFRKQLWRIVRCGRE